jgi:hypothetical protein
MTRNELKEIIREEIENILAETGFLDEAKKRKKRASFGKTFVNKSDPSQGERYTSAGTVPITRDRKMSAAQVAARKALGAKLLNAFRRGDKHGKKLRRNITGHAIKQLGKKPSRKEMYSFIWALASDWTLKGVSYPDGLYSNSASGSSKKSGKSSGSSKTP